MQYESLCRISLKKLTIRNSKTTITNTSDFEPFIHTFGSQRLFFIYMLILWCQPHKWWGIGLCNPTTTFKITMSILKNGHIHCPPENDNKGKQNIFWCSLFLIHLLRGICECFAFMCLNLLLVKGYMRNMCASWLFVTSFNLQTKLSVPITADWCL